MPKIVIREDDQTSFGGFNDNYDVAYVPGLVDPSKATNPIDYRKPKLFTSVTDFKTWCGTEPVKFSEDQLYSSLKNTNEHGFASNAIPYSGVMFKAGAADPGYLYAIELLNAGLSVLYERINPDKLYMDVAPQKGSYYGLAVAEGGHFTTFDEYCSTATDLDNNVFENLFPDDGVYVENADSENDIESTKITIYYDSTVTHPVFEFDGKFKEILYVKDTVQGSHVKAVKTLDELNNALEGSENRISYVPAGDPSLGKDNKPFIKLEYSMTRKKDVLTWKDDTVYARNVVLTSSESGDVPIEVAGDVQHYMPDDWYVAFRNYGFNNTKFVESSKVTDGVTLQAPFYATDLSVICTIPNIYKELSTVYTGDVDYKTGLLDMGNYSIKYLTSGGYPTYEYAGNTIVSSMMQLAQNRGDCVALIDHTDNEYRESDISLGTSLYGAVRDDQSFSNGDQCSFATMFTPYASYNITTTQKLSARMPASFGYLLALASSIKSNAPWLAIAGAARGGVPNLSEDGITTQIPNGVADMMQRRDDIAVNAITNIKPYGQVIWGNRTLRKANDLEATSFLNVRNLISDVKKLCYQVARSLTFEQDNDVLFHK